MAEPKPMEKTADIGAVHDNAALGELHAQFIQCHVAILRQALADPIAMSVELAATQMALPPRRQRSGRPFELHQIVDETRRHAKVPGRCPVTVPSSTNAMTRLRNASGCDLAIGPPSEESQPTPIRELPESQKSRSALAHP